MSRIRGENIGGEGLHLVQVMPGILHIVWGYITGTPNIRIGRASSLLRISLLYFG